LSLARVAGFRYVEAETLNGMGLVYASMGKRHDALKYYNQALPIWRAMGNPDGEANTLANIALLDQERGDLNEALIQIEAAIQIIESLRTKVLSEQLRASYFSTVQNNYALYVDVLMRLHQLHPDDENEAKALEVSERARARSLLETLAESQADIRRGVDPALLERERSLGQLLKGKQAALTKLLNGKHTEEQAAGFKKDIAEILAQYEQVEGLIRQASPRYAALTQPQPLSAPEIQQQLDANTVLLEYALGDEHTYLWAVGPDSLRSFQLPKRSDVETAARHLYELLTARNKQVKGETEAQKQTRLEQAAAQYPQAAAALSKILLGPLAPLIKGKRLVIVADGALQYIPFSALPEPGGKTANPKTAPGNEDSLTPLVVSHEIVSLPSASALAVLRQEIKGRQPAPNIVAVLADPVFDPHDPRVEKTARRSEPSSPQQTQKAGGTRALEETQLVANPDTPSLSASLTEDRLTRSASEVGLDRSGELQFPRLAFSRREAEAIVAAAPADKTMMAVDFKASLQTATDPELSHYRIVHFATHGLLNSEHPELSGLVLSLVDQQGRPEDGFLQLQDIYNLNLPADLVVLSACETGLGKEIRGEGLMGLTRGFMYAGASRVIASLWKVDDVATAELMEHLYHGMLTKGLRPAAALRQSQIEMWKQKRWESPYYWAAFVIQGEWK
jgi:CHAT domain-containing protein